jgi:hypothetical protein
MSERRNTDLEWAANPQRCECNSKSRTDIETSKLIRTLSPHQCQTAAALAEASEKGTMHVDHLEAVAKASLEFDKYLKLVYGGDDADRVYD